jgi:undecaprenyl diphosphate synthase
MLSKEALDCNRLPKHIAIIMDGNGRWAKERGADRIYGHHEGVLSVREVVQECSELGIKYLTLYAFSTENWNRPQAEVDAIMELLVATVRKETDELHRKKVKVHVIGDFLNLPVACQLELTEAMEMTKNNDGLNLIMALSYGSRQEIVNAAKTIALKAELGELSASDVNESVFSQCLQTACFPDPELLIRTSGEYRISNFLLFQIAYTELYFTPVHWPDFKKNELYTALLNYQQRERRFGKISEQIKTEHA